MCCCHVSDNRTPWNKRIPMRFSKRDSSRSLCIVNISLHCCELALVDKIFNSKWIETKSAGDIKVSANIHCSNLFTWDGGKALGDAWPGSNSAQLEQTCCLALAVSTYREETNHRRQTSLDLCWWLTWTLVRWLVRLLCGYSIAELVPVGLLTTSKRVLKKSKIWIKTLYLSLLACNDMVKTWQMINVHMRWQYPLYLINKSMDGSG